MIYNPHVNNFKNLKTGFWKLAIIGVLSSKKVLANTRKYLVLNVFNVYKDFKVFKLLVVRAHAHASFEG